MLRIGAKEAQAVRKVLLSGKLFRYQKKGGQCNRFEQRFGKYIGVPHVCMTASGTQALTAALIGLRIGPGDEVLVPACTYMASAIAVLAAGAIPVVVDVDESVTISPDAITKAIGPRTKAVMPVHMWGLPCDMTAIMKIARKHDLLVIEDVAQAVGGAYKGRMLGSFGQASGFSFNYYKNITCGEGGAVVNKAANAAERARCSIDCTSFYWNGRDEYTEHFAYTTARATEIGGAILNVQLGRLPAMIRAMNRQKKRILAETADSGLTPAKLNDIDGDCGTATMFVLPTAERADRFEELTGGRVCMKTGRHVYTMWAPILGHNGAHHPALDPFKLKENKGCRMDYGPDVCAASLDILARTVMISNHPDCTREDVTRLIAKINKAARKIL